MDLEQGPDFGGGMECWGAEIRDLAGIPGKKLSQLSHCGKVHEEVQLGVWFPCVTNNKGDLRSNMGAGSHGQFLVEIESGIEIDREMTHATAMLPVSDRSCR